MLSKSTSEFFSTLTLVPSESIICLLLSSEVLTFTPPPCSLLVIRLSFRESSVIIKVEPALIVYLVPSKYSTKAEDPELVWIVSPSFNAISFVAGNASFVPRLITVTFPSKRINFATLYASGLPSSIICVTQTFTP